MKIHPPRWEDHPDVRSGDSLTMGERAADFLKKWFGTWTLLGLTLVTIAGWMVFQSVILKNKSFDPYPWLLLNICLSCLAAIQGIILQISANRGDRIASELALATHRNTQAILDLNELQLRILKMLTPEGGEEHDALHPSGSDPESDGEVLSG